MNIKLTNKEASEIIKAHFFREAQPSVVLNIQSIEIEESADPVYSSKKTVELMKLVEAVLSARDNRSFPGSRKIAAIKAVRAEAESQGFFVGLADAKLFVEQFIP